MATYDGGGFYSHCGCDKPALLQWDPHPDCVLHIPSSHYRGVVRDFDLDGIPQCPYCRTITRTQRLDWIRLWDNRESEAPASRASKEPSYVEAGYGANASRRASLDLPPSGTVTRRESWADATVTDPPNPTIGYFPRDTESVLECSDGVDGDHADEDASPVGHPSSPHEGEDGAGDSTGSAPATILGLLKDVFWRAARAHDIAPVQTKEQDPVVQDAPTMAETQKESTLPPHPHYERAFKKAESDSTLKSSSKFKYEGASILSVEVKGLNFKDRKIPMPEKDVLHCSAGFRVPAGKETPKLPTVWGKDVDKSISDCWYASMRTAGLASSAGMIAFYIRRLCSVSNIVAHKAVLSTAQISEDDFADVVGTDGGLDFVLQVGRAAEVVGSLLFSIALEAGTVAASATLARRRLWMEATGVKDDYCDQWMKHNTSSNQGLFGLTPEMIAVYKAQQESRDTVKKELTPMMKAPATTGSNAGRGTQANKAATEKGQWRQQYPRKNWKKGKKGKDQRSQSQSSTEPPAKASRPTTESTDATRKPPASK